MPQLLLELFSEEIPARMQAGAARDLDRLMRDRLARAELKFESLKTFAGSRRLTLVAEGLPATQEHRLEERKGPRVGAPAQALEGFLRSAGVSREDLIERDGVYFATLSRGGRATPDIIAETVEAIVREFPWPKSMVWGEGRLRWVRPLHRILCLFDGNIVPLTVDGIVAGNLTQGHRFMGGGQTFPVADFADYQRRLAAHFVVLDADDRKARILAAARAVCVARGLELVEDQGLLDEVAGMVEWPAPLLGDMDPAFLALPPEVVRTSMRAHQRYFAVRRPGGEGLAPHFVVVANIEASDGGALIAAGAARVLSARLNDAQFFWREDRMSPLASRLEALKGVTFHAKLGSMFERIRRVESLASRFALLLDADPGLAREAARLAKADLVTAMVGEFPELQGIMGAYYASAEGLDPSVVEAIRDHYKPQGPSDGLPRGAVGASVALADKLDTLVGFFDAGERPTGSGDRFALRRTALGLIRIVLDVGVPIPLRTLIAFSGIHVALLVIDLVADSRLNRLSYSQLVAAVGDPAIEVEAGEKLRKIFQSLCEQDPIEALGFWLRLKDTAWIEDVLSFILDRLKVLLRDQGTRHDICDAAFAIGDDDLVKVTGRIRALESFLATEEGANLLAGYRRAANILDAEARKGEIPEGEPESVATPDEELRLIFALIDTRREVEAALGSDDFATALSALAALRGPVDAFFDGVLVNSPEPAERANRLRLLRGVCSLMEQLADFSLIVG
jgi:glycyl-tRNA synthetase beta chain